MKSSLGTITSKTLSLGIEENYQRLSQEFYTSILFFAMLILAMFLKGYWSRKRGEKTVIGN
ncbi:MAG: hypothetical protein GWO38_27240 [Phycisphaerae bacterium]|nr:hypothetical protein [Phycisphaerae bacterium]NIX01484.1 hypothetical protein [Phycisphaerae bacterium]NIX31221.1 hypothetical protein [Phycisphaerae bacterium]